ncbi:MAG: hypothetical protein KIS81_05185 [Maricaulaceae bacterium]|nr:hypothetical protein [Maricaulaceae bacterium]
MTGLFVILAAFLTSASDQDAASVLEAVCLENRPSHATDLQCACAARETAERLSEREAAFVASTAGIDRSDPTVILAHVLASGMTMEEIMALQTRMREAQPDIAAACGFGEGEG